MGAAATSAVAGGGNAVSGTSGDWIGTGIGSIIGGPPMMRAAKSRRSIALAASTSRTYKS